MTLDERIIEAQRRISAGLAPMRIPADQCDPDIVLSACQETIAELVEVTRPTCPRCAVLLDAALEGSVVTSAPSRP